MLLRPVQMVLTTVIDENSAMPCASDKVMSGIRLGRHGIAIAAVEKVYIGDADVASSTGMPIAAGTIWEIPVEDDVKVPCYVVGGKCVLMEYF